MSNRRTRHSPPPEPICDRVFIAIEFLHVWTRSPARSSVRIVHLWVFENLVEDQTFTCLFLLFLRRGTAWSHQTLMVIDSAAFPPRWNPIWVGLGQMHPAPLPF